MAVRAARKTSVTRFVTIKLYHYPMGAGLACRQKLRRHRDFAESQFGPIALTVDSRVSPVVVQQGSRRATGNKSWFVAYLSSLPFFLFRLPHRRKIKSVRIIRRTTTRARAMRIAFAATPFRINFAS